MKLKVQFGGGCGDVEFMLVTPKFVIETNPPQMNIRLSFYNEDITSYKLGNAELSFDLTQIQYLGTYD